MESVWQDENSKQDKDFWQQIRKLIEGQPGFFKSFGQSISTSLQQYLIFCRIFINMFWVIIH